MSMNVLKFYPFCAKYYLLRPWEFIKQTCRNFQWAYQRATRGFADSDTWNLDTYLLDLIPEAVEYLRKNTHGFPGVGRFSTSEAWDNYLLNEIVIPLRNARAEQQIKKNEFEYIYEEYPIEIKDHVLVDEIPTELVKKWATREQEIYRWREEQRIKGFMALINEEVFHNLWD